MDESVSGGTPSQQSGLSAEGRIRNDADNGARLHLRRRLANWYGELEASRDSRGLEKGGARAWGPWKAGAEVTTNGRCLVRPEEKKEGASASSGRGLEKEGGSRRWQHDGKQNAIEAVRVDNEEIGLMLTFGGNSYSECCRRGRDRKLPPPLLGSWEL